MTRTPDGDHRMSVRSDALLIREASVRAREEAIREREAAVTAREAMLSVTTGQQAGAPQDAGARDRFEDLLREANQNLVLATIHADEMTEECRRRAADLMASEERFRSLVITSTAILFHADNLGRIAVDPGSWKRVTGLDATFEEQQAPGWGWLQAVPPEDQKAVREAWTRAISTGQVYTLKHRLRRRDGGHAWVMARAIPLRRIGRVEEWIGTMTDISDQVRVEEAREQFITVLAHDLRSPLSAILFSAELLRSSGLSPHAEELVARVTRSGLRIDAMIRDLLDFARGRLADGIGIERRSCDLAAICFAEVEDARVSHTGRTILCESVGNVTGEWDPDRMEQVLSNLIANALDHGADPITVRAVDAGADVLLSVHNHGAPIAAELLPTIFEPYRRGRGTGQRGLGLGLYIVSEIVRAHGAAIAVRSKAGEGTSFTIRWPRRPRPPGTGAAT